MKLAFFDEFRLGVVVQNQIFDITEELRDVPRRGPEDLMPLLIERFADYRGRIEAVVARTPGVDLSQAEASGSSSEARQHCLHGSQLR